MIERGKKRQIYREPQLKEFEIDNTQIQVNDLKAIPPIKPGIEENRVSEIYKGMVLNIYIDEKTNTKYIDKSIADELNISELINYITRQEQYYCKVTD